MLTLLLLLLVALNGFDWRGAARAGVALVDHESGLDAVITKPVVALTAHIRSVRWTGQANTCSNTHTHTNNNNKGKKNVTLN